MTGTSFKYYIFPQNTPWGVIRKADGTLVYKHVINFPHEYYDELREQFINRYLNNDGNYKQDLENSKARAFDFLSDTRIHFRKNVGNNLDRLSNADFMVIKIGGVEKFYALKVLKIQGQVIDFQGELDIFFTYKMRVREYTQNPVFRAHLNRLVDDGTRFKLPNVTEFPELNFGREIDLPLLKNELKDWDNVTDYKVLNNENDECINFPKEIKWLTLFYQAEETETHLELFKKPNIADSNFKLKYKIATIPIQFVRANENHWFHIKGVTGATSAEELGLFKFNFELDNPAILGLFLSDNPFYLFKKENWEFIYIPVNNTYKLKSKTNFSFELLFKNNIHFQGGESIQSLHLDFFNLIGEKKTSQGFFSKTHISNFNKDPKIFSEQYFKVIFSTNNKQNSQEYTLFNSLITKNENTGLWINKTHAMNLTNLTQTYFLESLVGDNLISKKIFVDDEIAEIPTSIDKWKEYYIQNKNAIQANKIRASSQAVLGVGGAAAGVIALALAPFTAGASLAALVGVGIAGATTAATTISNYANTLNSIESTEKDLKNQIATHKQVNTGLMGRFFTEFNSTILFYTQSLDEFNEKKLLRHLKIFGYNYGGNLANVNQFLENRRHWNFVMAHDIFNTIDLQVSSPIKQIIGQAFQDGITFWHYRGGGDFLGVLTYDTYENREMNWRIPWIRAKKKW